MVPSEVASSCRSNRRRHNDLSAYVKNESEKVSSSKSKNSKLPVDGTIPKACYSAFRS